MEDETSSPNKTVEMDAVDELCPCSADQDWDNVEKALQRHAQCVDLALKKALDQQQWGFLEKISRICTQEQIGEVLKTALEWQQWDLVLTLSEVCSVIHRGLVATQALEHDLWVPLKRLAQLDLPLLVRQDICHRAINVGQWSVVPQLAESGVSIGVRDAIMSKAVECGQTESALLMQSLGISAARRASIPKELMGPTEIQNGSAGHLEVCRWCDFVVGLLHHCSQLTEDTLCEALKVKHWALLDHMVRCSQLNTSQLNKVGMEAERCEEWSLALEVVKTNPEVSFSTVSMLVAKGHNIIDLFPAGNCSSVLKAKLLLACFRHHQDKQADRTLRQCSDLELMEAVKMAAREDLRHEFLFVVRKSPRYRRAFLQHFGRQQWSPCVLSSDFVGIEVEWVFPLLFYEDKKLEKLAFHIAMSMEDTRLAVHFITHAQHCDYTNKRYWQCVKKVYDANRDDYSFICRYILGHADSKLIVPRLFRFAVKQGADLFLEVSENWLDNTEGVMKDYKPVNVLCDLGVWESDLKFAVKWILASGCADGGKKVNDLCCRLMDDYQPSGEFLSALALKFALKYYLEAPSEWMLDNVRQLLQNRQCDQDILADKSARKAVKLAVLEAVKHEDTTMFSSLCKIFEFKAVAECKRTYSDLLGFAFETAVVAEKSCVVESCLSALAAEQSLRIVLDVVNKTKKWSVLSNVLHRLLQNLATPATRLDLLTDCVKMMLRDPNCRPVLAQEIDSSLKVISFGLLDRVTSYIERRIGLFMIAASHRLYTQLASWCYKQGYFHLTLLLAFSCNRTRNYHLVNAVLKSEAFELSKDFVSLTNFLRVGLSRAFGDNKLSTCAELCRFFPLSLHGDNMAAVLDCTGDCQLYFKCMERGIYDWALVLAFSNDMPDVVFELLKSSQRFSQGAADLALRLVDRIDTQETRLQYLGALFTKFRYESSYLRLRVKEMVEQYEHWEDVGLVFDRVDPCTLDVRGSSSLLGSLDQPDQFTILQQIGITLEISSDAAKLKFVQLCIAAGISSYQRLLEIQTQSVYWSKCLLNASLCCPAVVKVLLESGCFSKKAQFEFSQSHHQALFAFPPGGDPQLILRLERKQESLRLIAQAASNVASLQHLARLTVSSMIGSHPGRKERVQALGASKVVEELVLFQDNVVECARAIRRTS